MTTAPGCFVFARGAAAVGQHDGVAGFLSRRPSKTCSPSRRFSASAGSLSNTALPCVSGLSRAGLQSKTGAAAPVGDRARAFRTNRPAPPALDELRGHQAEHRDGEAIGRHQRGLARP